MDIAGWIILVLVAAAVLVAVAAWFYERATNEVSLLRTGFGGRRVVIDGGVLAIPYFHEITRISMRTLRLDVERRGEASLITQDRLRVDVGAEFHVSVEPSGEAVTRAAQTLGDRTFERGELGSLIEGMLVDALRSAAARMTMDELHENRSGFVSDVRGSLSDTLSRYGLRVDGVSLTALDQTPFSTLDENNAFNAVGMRKLAEVIAKSKKERAEIDAESEVSVRRSAMEAKRERLDIDLEERRAEIAQRQEIETLAAAQIAEIAQRKADSELSAAEARIDMERRIEIAEIERNQASAIADRDREIALSTKSQEESRARTEAEQARVEAILAAEAVETARAKAEAERRAELARIAAESEARAAAARSAISAESEKNTAADKAAAHREAAEADKAAKLAEAEANRARIEAENSRSDAVIAMELEKARLEAMPEIVAQLVKPAEKIESINVNHVTGLGGGTPSEGAVPKSPVEAAVDSILTMAVQLPTLKTLGDRIGASLGGETDAKDEPRE